MKEVCQYEPPGRYNTRLIGKLCAIDQSAEAQPGLSDAQRKFDRRAGLPTLAREFCPEQGKKRRQRKNEEGVGGAKLCGGEWNAKKHLVGGAIGIERHRARRLLKERPEHDR